MASLQRDSACLFCGDAELIDVAEVWADHSFQVETCCWGLHEALAIEMSEDAERGARRSGPAWFREIYRRAVGRELRRVIAADGQLLADHCLSIEPIAFAIAKAFVRNHHAHSRPPVGWKYGAGIYNGQTLVGVVIVGRPVAPALDRGGDTLEVTRLCLDRQIHRELRWNACSQAYGWAANEAARRGYARIVTYIREDESGASLIAAGWTCDRRSPGGRWDRPSRSRPEASNTGPKLRWARELVSTRSRRAA